MSKFSLSLPGKTPHTGARLLSYVDANSPELTPFDWQKKFHESDSTFKGFSGPVGSGKSQALCWEALQLSYNNRGCTGVIGAPTYPMLRDSTFVSFRSLLDDNDVPYKFIKNEFKVILPEAKSEILFRALDEFERIRGSNLAWFGIDELTYCKPESWLRLEARMRSRKAKRLCGFASWTPKGYDWVYDRFIGPDKKPAHKAFFAEQNVTLAGYYDRLKSSYTDRFYKQEALGEYLNVFAGQAYYAFSRKEQVYTTLKYNPQQSLWWSIDFNINPMSSVIGQTWNGVVRVLEELSLPDSNTLAACEEFLSRTAGYFSGSPLPVYIYGDASGDSRKTSSSRTDWQIVKEFFGRYPERFSAHFRVPSGNGPVKDRVNCVNAMLRNYAGKRQLVVAASCRELAKDFEQLAWKADANGNPYTDLDKRDPMRSHMSDALGYMVVREFPMKDQRGEMGGRQIV